MKTSKTKRILTLWVTLLLCAAPLLAFNVAKATTPDDEGNFSINILGSISIDIDAPSSSDTFYQGRLIANKVGVSVSSNLSGYTVTLGMAGEERNLVNSFITDFNIPALNSANVAVLDDMDCIEKGCWGYNVVSTGADAPTSYSKISEVGTAGNTIVTTTEPGVTTKRDIYFGAMPGVSTPAGTYSNTVIINAVSNVAPDVPSDGGDDGGNNTGGSNTDTQIAYSTPVSTSKAITIDTGTGGDTTNTGVPSGSNNSRSSYSAPLGETVSTISEGTPMATGLAITAAIAAISGILFFILAKRRRDDEDEDY